MIDMHGARELNSRLYLYSVLFCSVLFRSIVLVVVFANVVAASSLSHPLLLLSDSLVDNHHRSRAVAAGVSPVLANE